MDSDMVPRRHFTNEIFPRVLLVLTGSSLILFSPHLRNWAGSAGMPHWQMKPGITR